MANTIKKLEIADGIISLIAGIVLIVFSCINSSGSMLAMAICGIVLLVMGLTYMILYSREKKKNR